MTRAQQNLRVRSFALLSEPSKRLLLQGMKLDERDDLLDVPGALRNWCPVVIAAAI